VREKSGFFPEYYVSPGSKNAPPGDRRGKNDNCSI